MRIQKTEYVSQLFNPDHFIPAVGQGALCLQCRENDGDVQRILHLLHDVNTSLAVASEQALIHRLNGDCHTPIGAYATISGDTLLLRACIGDQETGTILQTAATGPSEQAQLVGITAADDLIAKGANTMHD
jgi:hydroxymethylbilane synthase